MGKEKGDIKEIQNSLAQQTNFTNFKAVYIKQGQAADAQDEELIAAPELTYEAYRQAINTHCQKNALVLITSNPLIPTALYNLNSLHQSYSAWISYNVQGEGFQVNSFYRRIFDLVAENDFDRTNSVHYQQKDEGLIALALIELSQRHKRSIMPRDLFQKEENPPALSVKELFCVAENRVPYQPLFSINQDYPIKPQ